MKDNLPQRKSIRISNYDYSNIGIYFITICIKNRKNILSKIKKEKIILSQYGKIVEKYILTINAKYNYICIHSYVIMPNHVHFLCEIKAQKSSKFSYNATIPFVISNLKRLTNKEFRENIWQRNYYEHIVRNKIEYQKITEYIENNPMNWKKDKQFQ